MAGGQREYAYRGESCALKQEHEGRTGSNQRRGKGQQGTQGATGGLSLSPQNVPLWQEDYFRLIIFKKHRRSSVRSDPFLEESFAFLRGVSICEVIFLLYQQEEDGSPSLEALSVPKAKTERCITLPLFTVLRLQTSHT